MGLKFYLRLNCTEPEILCKEQDNKKGNFSIPSLSLKLENNPLEYTYNQKFDKTYFLISNWLQTIEQSVENDKDNQFKLMQLFSDAFLDQTDGSSRFLDIKMPNAKNPTDKELINLAAFYKAVRGFLDECDRIERWNARLAYLYTTWQWYSTLKFLFSKENEINDKSLLLPDFAYAYRCLNQIFDNDEYALTSSQMQKWAGPILRSGPLLREKLKISLILWNKNAEPDFTRPNDLIKSNCPSSVFINWNKFCLHPVFERQESARKGVRAIISEYVLPRYDFDTSIQLASLLKENKPAKKIINSRKYFIFVFLWLALTMALGTYLTNFMGGLETAPWKIFILSAGELFLGIISLVFFFSKKHEISMLHHLAAPRIIGGVMIGYLTILLQGDSITLNNVLWNHFNGLLLLILWILVFSAGWLYLYYDILPQVRDRHESILRTGSIMLLSFLISFLMGLAVNALATAMYPAENLSAEICQAWACKVYVLGPFGWLNLAYMLTFVPLAFFTGLITQFIFEERTVTSPVWAPEED